MIINREVLNNTKSKKESYTENMDMFEYTLELAGNMNDDISLFMESVNISFTGGKKIFDFEAILNAIINAFINAIKALFRRFLALLAKLASMGSSFEIQLRAYKEKIKAYRGDVTVHFPYYHFSNIHEGYPSFNVYEQINSIITRYDTEYNEIMSHGALSVSKLGELEGKIDVQNEQAKFRGTLFNTSSIYSGTDFAKDAFSFFRSNNDMPLDQYTVTNQEVHQYYEDYINANKEIRKIEKEKNDIEKKMNNIKGRIKKDYFKAALTNFAEADRQKVEQSTVAIQRKICTIVDLMCQDILLVFGQKLQAYKDYKIQGRKVLVSTIQAIIVQGE